jgi:hypothetical protein
VSTLTERRPAFRSGTVVMLHPETNPDAGDHDRNDRGTVVACRPMDDMRHLDLVSVVWTSRLANLSESEQELPLSHWATPHVSTRLRAVRTGA